MLLIILLADNTWDFVLTGGFTLGPTKAAAELFPTGDEDGCFTSVGTIVGAVLWGIILGTDEVIGCLTAVTQLTAGMMCVCGATAEIT